MTTEYTYLLVFNRFCIVTYRVLLTYLSQKYKVLAKKDEGAFKQPLSLSIENFLGSKVHFKWIDDMPKHFSVMDNS